jgi:type III pantothenate kinase
VILCVDIGNSATKIAIVNGTRVVRKSVVSAKAPVREVAHACARVMRGARAIDAAALTSVRPDATDAVVRIVVGLTGQYPIVVNHRTPMPMRIAVRRPEKVGTDRLCAACGALGSRRRDAIVITVGSAITVNLIRNRVFLGGVIMPGPAMSLKAMHTFTAQLPDLDIDAPAPARIDDTESAMHWGAVLAGAGGVRLAVEMLDRRAGRRPTRFVTGGYAPRLGRWLPAAWKSAPDLTLLGLAAIVGCDTRK